MRRSRLAPLLLISALAVLTAAGPASGEERVDPREDHAAHVRAQAEGAMVPLVTSDNVDFVMNVPGSAGISGCFMTSKPLFVVSNIDSIKVYDVSKPLAPRLVGVLPDLKFENEAMNCGERVTAAGVERFVLVGVDLFQASPDDLQHANVGGGELIVVDVTKPSAPYIRSRTPGSTSTHTLTCATPRDCRYAYSAGEDDHFSIFDLSDLDKPRERDADKAAAGVQPFPSPTAGHKWNFDQAGYATHTGWNGTSLWDVRHPRKPVLVTSTGKAGRGEDPRFKGWNDFIHHNSYRPNAKRFKPNTPPSVANGNVLLVTEEDYEQTDCTKAGSFQTWWVKRLNGKDSKIVPLDKVELSDLGTFPVPQYAFCSSHWFDFHQSGIAAVGFYGGGTQLIDVRDARNIKSYGHASWGVSEAWDTMWVPVYRADGTMTKRKTNVAYSIDLVRGLDVYAVKLPSGPKLRLASSDADPERPTPAWWLGVLLVLVGVAGLHRRAAVKPATAGRG